MLLLKGESSSVTVQTGLAVIGCCQCLFGSEGGIQSDQGMHACDQVIKQGITDHKLRILLCPCKIQLRLTTEKIFIRDYLLEVNKDYY